MAQERERVTEDLKEYFNILGNTLMLIFFFAELDGKIDTTLIFVW